MRLGDYIAGNLTRRLHHQACELGAHLLQGPATAGGGEVDGPYGVSALTDDRGRDRQITAVAFLIGAGVAVTVRDRDEGLNLP